MSEVSINKHNKSIVIARGDIAFSQFGIADKISDLIIEQGMEIERLNNIINNLENELARVYEIELDYPIQFVKEEVEKVKLGVDKE